MKRRQQAGWYESATKEQLRARIHAFVKAAENGFEAELSERLRQGQDINAPTVGGRTALHESSRGGHLACVRLLLSQKGIRVNLVDENGQTALHAAVQKQRNLDLLRALLEAGCDPTIVDKSGMNAQQYAKEMHNVELEQFIHEWDPQRDLFVMCDYLGINRKEETYLLWIAKEMMNTPLPDGWLEMRDEQGAGYYLNITTSETSWEHPLRNLFIDQVEAMRYKHNQNSKAITHFRRTVLHKFSVSWLQQSVKQRTERNRVRKATNFWRKRLERHAFRGWRDFMDFAKYERFQYNKADRHYRIVIGDKIWSRWYTYAKDRANRLRPLRRKIIRFREYWTLRLHFHEWQVEARRTHRIRAKTLLAIKHRNRKLLRLTMWTLRRRAVLLREWRRKLLNIIVQDDLFVSQFLGPRDLYNLKNTCRNFNIAVYHFLVRADVITVCLDPAHDNGGNVRKVLDMYLTFPKTKKFIQDRLSNDDNHDRNAPDDNHDRNALNIHHVYLNECKFVSDTFLREYLVKALPKLKTLSLAYCPKLTDAGIIAIANNLPMLETLDVSCSSIQKASSLRTLLQNCRCLRHLRLSEIDTSFHSLMISSHTGSTRYRTFGPLASHREYETCRTFLQEKKGH